MAIEKDTTVKIVYVTYLSRNEILTKTSKLKPIARLVDIALVVAIYSMDASRCYQTV